MSMVYTGVTNYLTVHLRIWSNPKLIPELLRTEDWLLWYWSTSLVELLLDHDKADCLGMSRLLPELQTWSWSMPGRLLNQNISEAFMSSEVYNIGSKERLSLRQDLPSLQVLPKLICHRYKNGWAADKQYWRNDMLKKNVLLLLEPILIT